MKFVMASYGSRGDIEPCVAASRELLRMGHEVQLAVPPDQVGLADAVGLSAVPYGLEFGPWMDVHRDFWTRFFRDAWKSRDVVKLWREVWEPTAQCWDDISTTPFGFGSIAVESPGETLSIIGAACEPLGQRALVGAGLRAGVP